MATSNSDIVRAVFRAYLDQDRETADRLLADDTTAQAAAERIFEQISDFHNWTKWSPWEGLDPQMERTYSGPESGAGAVYAWSGNRKAGQGRMEIADAAAPSRVHIDLSFEKPWKSRNDTVFVIEDIQLSITKTFDSATVTAGGVATGPLRLLASTLEAAVGPVPSQL